MVAQRSAAGKLAIPGLYGGVTSPPSRRLIACPAFRVSDQSLRLYRSAGFFMSGSGLHNAIWHGFILLAASCLFGGPRLLALDISGLPRLDRKQTSRNYLADARAVVSSLMRNAMSAAPRVAIPAPATTSAACRPR